MKDHKALQGATSHYFGDKFSRAYNVTFTGRDNKVQYPFQTSWGSTTRMIGAVIMAHGDNNGLVLPPKIAPIQVIVLPIAQHKPGVLEKAQELVDRLAKLGLRVKGDFTDNSPGWKFANWEMKGVPLRIEIGPKDIENNQCVAVRRDDREKLFLSLDELEAKVPELLDAVQKSLYEKAKANMEEHTYPAYSLEEAKKIQEEKGGFIKTMWCGELACEMKMKEQAGMSSRCMPLHQERLADVLSPAPSRTMPPGISTRTRRGSPSASRRSSPRRGTRPSCVRKFSKSRTSSTSAANNLEKSSEKSLSFRNFFSSAAVLVLEA